MFSYEAGPGEDEKLSFASVTSMPLRWGYELKKKKKQEMVAGKKGIWNQEFGGLVNNSILSGHYVPGEFYDWVPQ